MSAQGSAPAGLGPPGSAGADAPGRRDDTPPATAGEHMHGATQGSRGRAAVPGRAPARRPGPTDDPGIRNCSCATRPGIVADGPDAARIIAAFECDHGPGGECGQQLVRVPLSKMGRAQRA